MNDLCVAIAMICWTKPQNTIEFSDILLFFLSLSCFFLCFFVSLLLCYTGDILMLNLWTCVAISVCRWNELIFRALSVSFGYEINHFIFLRFVLFSASSFSHFDSFVCISFALDCTTMQKLFIQNWIFHQRSIIIIVIILKRMVSTHQQENNHFLSTTPPMTRNIFSVAIHSQFNVYRGITIATQ